jgi:hypothetical protein
VESGTRGCVNAWMGELTWVSGLVRDLPAKLAWVCLGFPVKTESDPANFGIPKSGSDGFPLRMSDFRSAPITVEGELGVAGFLVNYFSGVHFQTLVAVHPCPVVLQGPLLTAAE